MDTSLSYWGMNSKMELYYDLRVLSTKEIKRAKSGYNWDYKQTSAKVIDSAKSRQHSVQRQSFKVSLINRCTLGHMTIER